MSDTNDEENHMDRFCSKDAIEQRGFELQTQPSPSPVNKAYAGQVLFETMTKTG